MVQSVDSLTFVRKGQNNQVNKFIENEWYGVRFYTYFILMLMKYDLTSVANMGANIFCKDFRRTRLIQCA